MSLLPVLYKLALDIHPYDAGETGLIGAGAGALAGGALGAGVGAAIAPKGKRPSSALKAALIGMLGGGGLGGFMGYSAGAGALEATYKEMFGEKGVNLEDASGNVPDLVGLGGKVKGLYETTGQFARKNELLNAGELKALSKDTPENAWNSHIPLASKWFDTVKAPSTNAIGQVSGAMRNTLQDKMRNNITLKPGQLLSLILKRDPRALDTDFGKFETSIEPELQFLDPANKTAPSQELTENLARQYRP